MKTGLSCFAKVRGMIAEAGRLGAVKQALVNPSDETLWNVLSACSNTGASCCRAKRISTC